MHSAFVLLCRSHPHPPLHWLHCIWWVTSLFSSRSHKCCNGLQHPREKSCKLSMRPLFFFNTNFHWVNVFILISVLLLYFKMTVLMMMGCNISQVFVLIQKKKSYLYLQIVVYQLVNVYVVMKFVFSAVEKENRKGWNGFSWPLKYGNCLRFPKSRPITTFLSSIKECYFEWLWVKKAAGCCEFRIKIFFLSLLIYAQSIFWLWTCEIHLWPL